MTEQLTTTTATPVRISAEHYQIESQSKERAGRRYDLHFNHELKRWTCNCPDVRHNHRARCKHIRLLVAWINERSATEQKIEAEANAVVEQAMAKAAGPAPVHCEYGPVLPEPEYLTEARSRIARLEGHMQANECEVALVADRLAVEVKEVRESFATLESILARQAEQREALQEQLEQTQQRLLEMEARHNALLHEMEALHARVAELAQVQPVRITTEQVVIDATALKVTRHVERATVEAIPAPPLKEVHRDGRFIGCEIDGYQVRVAHGMVMGCFCSEGQDKPCKHTKAVEAYLAKKRETAPLGENKAFSLTR